MHGVEAFGILLRQVDQPQADDPETAARQGADVRDRLTARLAGLEARIEEAYAKSQEEELSAQDYENLYRLLGAFRGLSEAGADFIRTGGAIAWDRWREARF